VVFAIALPEANFLNHWSLLRLNNIQQNHTNQGIGRIDLS